METNPAHGRMQEAPEPAHGHTEPEPHHAVPYVLIFWLLVALTAVTVLAALHRFHSEWINLAIALAIATTKAAFVALFFMHLKFEGKLIRVILFVPLCLCILLIVALIPDIVFHGPLNGPPAESVAAHAP